MWELIKRISLKISSVLTKVEPEPTKKYRLRLRNTCYSYRYLTVGRVNKYYYLLII